MADIERDPYDGVEQGCDCPHFAICVMAGCTQCCAFDVTPDPADCHDPANPYPLGDPDG